jgi:diacylglycerol kinase family enzyme
MPNPRAPGSPSPLFVVCNRSSGRGEQDELREAIESACRAAGRPLQLMEADASSDLGTVARDAVQRARAAGGVVVAAGGDGTINTVVQAALGSGCPVGVLPRGTFNYFSRTHGIPSEIGAALAVLLNESPRPVQGGLVNDRVFLVNASLGLYPQLLEDREAWKNQFGRSRLVAFGAGIATLLRGHRQLKLEVELKGQTREVRTPTLFVGNNALQMEQVGLPEARAIDSGELAGVTLRPVGRLALLALLARGALGQLGEAEQVVDFAFKRLTVSAPRGLGVRRMKVATDGEITRMTLPLTFRVSPEPLWLIRPEGLAAERQEARAAEPGDMEDRPA